MKSWRQYLDMMEEIDPSSKDLFRELPKISVVGCFQNGKSTFINCLLDELVACPGDGRATTKISTRYRWGELTKVDLLTGQGLQAISLMDYLNYFALDINPGNGAFQAEINLPKEILKKIELIDTPGFDANEKDTNNVTRSLDEADYAIVLINNKRALGESELKMFEFIDSKKIPYTIIMNCVDVNSAMEWYPHHKKNEALIKENEAILNQWGYVSEKIDGDSLIYPCNLLWYWFATQKNNLSFSFSDSLSDRIEFILNRKKENLSKSNIVQLSNFSKIKYFFQTRLANIN